MNPLDGQLQNANLMQGQSQLEKLKQTYLKPSTNDEKKLKKAAQEFESIFMQQLLDAMDKTVDRQSSLFDSGTSQEYWRSMLNQEVSKSISNRTGGSGFGLAESIYRQMAQNITPDSTGLKMENSEPSIGNINEVSG